MTTQNLRIAVNKAIEILPTKLEIIKLRNTLTEEEDAEYRKTIDDHPITKQIIEEEQYYFKNDRERFNKRLLERVEHSFNTHFKDDVIGGILGDKFSTMTKEIMDESTENFKDGNTYIKSMAARMFKKIVNDDETLNKMLDRVQEESDKFDVNTRKRFVDDHTLK